MAWGRPLDEVESLPFEVLAEFKALNAWSPFTPDRQAHQLGLIASMLSHKVYKKGFKSEELFPYLQNGIPDFLEDERVSKARKLIESFSASPERLRDEQLKAAFKAIREEIELEEQLDIPDMYVVRELKKILTEAGDG